MESSTQKRLFLKLTTIPNISNLLVGYFLQAPERDRVRGGGAFRPSPLAAHVSAPLFDDAVDAPAQQTLHRRLQPQHRRSQPHQLQHTLRGQNANDHLSRYSFTRVYSQLVHN
jgi:hypothetical protein